jgi:hypothetical protein
MSSPDALSVLNEDERARLECRELSLQETAAFRDSWRRVYARPLKRAHGVWHRGKYDWHVFSFDDTFALSLNDARSAYLVQPQTELVVIPNDKKGTGVKTAVTKPPDLDGHADIYISPPNLSWTMVYTHEDGWFGPYFSRAEWVDHPPPAISKAASKGQRVAKRKK